MTLFHWCGRDARPTQLTGPHMAHAVQAQAAQHQVGRSYQRCSLTGAHFRRSTENLSCSHRPKSFASESVARAGFQILFERLRLQPFREGDVSGHLPGSVLRGVRGLAAVMLDKPTPKVRSHPDVAFGRLSKAFEEIDVVQRNPPESSPATRKASQGILLRPAHLRLVLRSPEGEAGWCGREDSNFHGLPHSDLNAARLPIPPRPPVVRRGGSKHRSLWEARRLLSPPRWP
jgi:hypothetical protein